MFTYGTSNSTISTKTLALIERAKNLTSKPTCTSPSPAILDRSTLSVTGLTSNPPSLTLTPDLGRALRHIAELEDGIKRSNDLLTLAMDRISKLEEQVTRCPTSTSTLYTPTTNSLLTPTSSPRTPKRRPTCAKGAECNFGHSAEESTTTTSDSEDSLNGRSYAPPLPRRSKWRPPPYRPKVMLSPPASPLLTPCEPCPPLLLPRLAHDRSPADLAEEQEIASTPATLRSRTALVDELLADVIGTVAKEAERRRAHLALAHSTNLIAQKYSERNKWMVDKDVDEDGVIRSPTPLTIRVDLGKVNAFALAKLPRPSLLPVHACATEQESCVHNGTHYTTCVHAWGCHGMLPGFTTTLGIIAPPTDPIHGYVYLSGHGKDTRFVLAAEAI